MEAKLPSAWTVTVPPAVTVPVVVTEASLSLMFTPTAKAPASWEEAALPWFWGVEVRSVGTVVLFSGAKPAFRVMTLAPPLAAVTGTRTI